MRKEQEVMFLGPRSPNSWAGHTLGGRTLNSAEELFIGAQISLLPLLF